MQETCIQLLSDGGKWKVAIGDCVFFEHDEPDKVMSFASKLALQKGLGVALYLGDGRLETLVNKDGSVGQKP